MRSDLFFATIYLFFLVLRPDQEIRLEESFEVCDCHQACTAHPYRRDGFILDAPPDGSNVDVQEARNVSRSNVGAALQVSGFCATDVLALFTSGLARQRPDLR